MDVHPHPPLPAGVSLRTPVGEEDDGVDPVDADVLVIVQDVVMQEGLPG